VADFFILEEWFTDTVQDACCSRNTQDMLIPGLSEMQVQRFMYRMTDTTAGAGIKSQQPEHAKRNSIATGIHKEQQQQRKAPDNGCGIFLHTPV